MSVVVSERFRRQCKIDANPIADNVDLFPNMLYYMIIEFDKRKWRCDYDIYGRTSTENSGYNSKKR